MAEKFSIRDKGVSDEMKAYIRNHFFYNGDTGEITRNDRRNSQGSYDKDGYLILKIKKHQFKAHRIAWFLQYGEFPVLEIDHINRVRTDNRLANLRVVSHAENIQNTTPKINKQTGVIGVYIDNFTIGLKKKFTTRLKGHTHRFYSLEDAVNFRKANNLLV